LTYSKQAENLSVGKTKRYWTNNNQLSEAQAAALLHLDRWDLLETMGRSQVPAVRLGQDALKRELAQKRLTARENHI